MAKEKKIKVEADITTKNNVSSGIGKGFGMVIGIFLALIVIAVSCSILISSNAKKIEEKSNEITANAIKEVYRAGEEAQQQIQKTFDESFKRLDEQEKSVNQLAKERQIGFPWLAKAYEEFFKLQDKSVIDFLQYKKHSAVSASSIVKEQSRLRREAQKEKKIAQYLVEYYENVAPFLLDLKEEVDIATEQERELLKEYSEEELEDATTQFLSKEEYRKLPSVQRNQMALDRFWKRPKSKWLIGRLYERYVGYLYEQEGYNVDYVGIFKGFEDLGRPRGQTDIGSRTESQGRREQYGGPPRGQRRYRQDGAHVRQSF